MRASRLASLAVIASIVSPLVHSAVIALTQAQKDAILARHNLFRAGVTPTASNMRQMQWSDTLATVAANYGSKCIWGHNSARTTDANGAFGYVGENLYISASSSVSSSAGVNAVNSWNSENTSYTYVGTCSGGNVCGTCASGAQCGHYTQNVWANTAYVGCAVVSCSAMTNNNPFTCSTYGVCTLVVCDYGEGGNYVNNAPYTRGTPCSKCPTAAPYCVDGALCSATSSGTTPSPTGSASTPAPTTKAPTAGATPAPTTKAPTAGATPAPTTKAPTSATTPAPTSSSSSGADSLTQAQKDAIVAQHNLYRSQVTPTAANMRMIQWSDTLASVAANYGSQCTWNHNSARTTQVNGAFTYVGENLYISASNNFNMNDGVKAIMSWNSENTSYTYAATCSGSSVCGACTGVCGHYTQNVWANTGYVGCAVVNCPSMVNNSPFQCSKYGTCTLVVCDYGQGGNYIRNAPYVSGTACSQCPSDAPYCVGGSLCSANADATPFSSLASGLGTADSTFVTGDPASPDSATSTGSPSGSSFPLIAIIGIAAGVVAVAAIVGVVVYKKRNSNVSDVYVVAHL